ncbi:glycoside hydrolase family 43 protein [Wenyingzhuangia marina]|uniref:Beta-xylosidase, GH43 family n=1 Tax=Wenyingzhuangia marina TaxID=1195760 RepID=A0A1M5WUW1_9FLAO|nr:glycoside hydrolase family 43 protein [Wenyingzhuangia marina]GGF82623.1 glycosyl hydrolase [Wenyingzhuangia marina]SHH91172.1 Beta-xylosidase, GH43 family [Wenyingzhuangia marina]
MKNRFKILVVFVVMMVCVSSCTDKKVKNEKTKEVAVKHESILTNDPIVLQRADPFIYKHTDGYYYFTGSVPTYDAIEIRRAKTIEDLQDAKPFIVWEKHESGPMSRHIWAPEIHYLDGKWYVYFAGSEEGDIWKLRPYVIECSGQNPLNDKWIELGQMQAADNDPMSFTDFSLDGTVFDHNGKRYFCWAEKTGGQFAASNLYLAEMESPIKLKTVQFMLTTPDYDWERIGFWVNEGPAVIKNGGKIFITFSASATGACYSMGMMEADEEADLLDRNSWTKSRHPVLKTNETKGIYGPGHNSFTIDENGNPLMIYHARSYEKAVGDPSVVPASDTRPLEDIKADPLYDPNRHARMMKVRFDKDGKPVFKYY